MPTAADKLSNYPAVPRYTSYPTAPHFYTLEPGTRAQWLSQVPHTATLSLYLHLPYCAKQCWYCGCHTRISRRYEPVAQYLQPLYEEISLVAQTLGRRQPVGHMHFGGGSPSLLRPEDFTGLMSHLSEAFELAPQSEIAIELDPRNTTEAKMAAYALAGVNRVSIGVQDFDPAVQKAINRQQPFHTVYETVRLAQLYGIEQHSFDLVYGLPQQTLAGFARTLEQVLLLAPGRLALFGYAHVPWMKKAMRLIDEQTLPDAALRCAMAAHAAARLNEAGYVTIGLDHFARADDPLSHAAQNKSLRRNFQGYGTDAHDTLISLGASAISHFPEGYVQNPPLIETYRSMLAKGALPQQKGFRLSAEDKLRKHVIETLMCDFAAALDEVSQCAGVSPQHFDACLQALRPLAHDGLVHIDGYRVTVPSEVPQAVRLVCAVFDEYYAPQPNRHAQVA